MWLNILCVVFGQLLRPPVDGAEGAGARLIVRMAKRDYAPKRRARSASRNMATRLDGPPGFLVDFFFGFFVEFFRKKI